MTPPSNSDLLTRVEANRWLSDGSLPANFRERVERLVESYRCPNCDGVQDMNSVFREWDAEQPSWCPFCVEPYEART